MTLKHDPSAIRYASTQEAYGTTWTLESIDSDGAQTWKNAKGHTALVQKAVEQVRQPQTSSSAGNIYSLDRIAKSYSLMPRPDPVWKPIDGQDLEMVERKPISDDRLKKTVNVTNVIPESYVADYSKLDAEIGQRLMEKGFFVDWHKAEKACASGRVSSTEPNESNKPKVGTNVVLSDNSTITDAYYYDRCLTNEEVRSIWSKGPDSVPGGKKIIQ